MISRCCASVFLRGVVAHSAQQAWSNSNKQTAHDNRRGLTPPSALNAGNARVTFLANHPGRVLADNADCMQCKLREL